MLRWTWLLGLLTALAVWSTAFAETTTTVLQPNDATVEDAFLAEARPDVGWGDGSNVPGATVKLFVGYLVSVPPGGEYRSVIKFMDLSAIPANAVVESATLTLTQIYCQEPPQSPLGCYGPDLTIAAHRVTSFWTEPTVRWMDMPSFDPVPLSTATIPNVMRQKLALDITPVFREWLTGASPNNGVILIEEPLIKRDYFYRGRSSDDIGVSYQGDSKPGRNGPSITVRWHYPETGAR